MWLICSMTPFFFFSSRRRHTRCSRDWSSDVCSSDLSIRNVDVFVVGQTAPEQMRKEMVEWLKANFPKVKIVALIQSANRQVPRADYNIVLNNGKECLSLLAATAS